MTWGLPTLTLGRLRLVSCSADELLSLPAVDCVHAVTVNAEIFVLAHQQAELGRLMDSTLNTIDGRIVQLLARWCSGTQPQKVAGSDFVYDAARWCEAQGHALFLLGAEPSVNAEAVRRLRARCPRLRIDGFAPPFAEEGVGDWTPEALDRIGRLAPTVLLVALGPPRQELWIAGQRAALGARGVRLAMGVGGTLDFVAGRVRRAPRWVQWAGLEWAYRLVQQPLRWRRTARMFLLPWYALRRPARPS